MAETTQPDKGLLLYYSSVARAHVVAHDIVEAARIFSAEMDTESLCTDWNAQDDEHDVAVCWNLKDNCADQPGGHCVTTVELTAAEWVDVIGKPALLCTEDF